MKTFGLYEEGFLAACTINGGGTGGGSGGGGGGGSRVGTTWTLRVPGFHTLYYRVVYGNSLFVAVGLGGIILTSPDGVSWTQRTSGTRDWLIGVTHGNGLFVAVGEWGTILTSP